MSMFYFEFPSDQTGLTIDEAHTAILNLIKGCVPEPWSPEGSDPQNTDGWNTCRLETLERMGKL